MICVHYMRRSSDSASDGAVVIHASDMPAPTFNTGRPEKTTQVEEFFAEMDWKKLTGKRISYSLLTYRDPSFKFLVFFHSFVINAVELASRWLESVKASVPLFELLDPTRNWAFQAAQFISAMLMSTSRFGLWRSSGWADFQTLHEQQPEVVAGMRVSSVVANVMLLMKLQWRFWRWPFLLAMVADVRRDMADRCRAAKAWWNSTEHDLDPGFSLPLRRRSTSWRDLFRRDNQELIYLWAKAHRLHSQRSERKHAGNRKAISSCTDYLHFVSRAANQQSLGTIVVEAPVVEEADGAPAALVAISKGPMRAAKMRWLNMRSAQTKMQIAGAAADFEAEWDQLSDQHKSNFLEYHKAELEKEFTERRQRKMLQADDEPSSAIVPFDAAFGSTVIASKDEGPSLSSYQIVKHVVGCGTSVVQVADGPKKDSAKRLEHLPMSVKALEDTLKKENLNITQAGELIDKDPSLCLARDRGAVPKKVKHFRPCIGLCSDLCDDASRVRRSTCISIEKAMQAVLKDAGAVAQSLKFLFCFEMFEKPDEAEDEERALCEFVMPVMLFQNGNCDIWQPTLAMIAFNAASDAQVLARPFADVRLTMHRFNYQPPADSMHAVFTQGVDVGA